MRKLLLLSITVLLTCVAYASPDSLLRVANSKQLTDTAQCSIYNKIGLEYLAANDTGKALFYLQKSKSVAEQQKFDKGIMNACSNIGLYYVRTGIIDSAVAYFSLCLEKAKEMNNLDVAAKICINIAGVYLSAGRYAESIQYYLEALQYLEKINDQPKIAVNYHCLGIAYYMLKNYPLSLKYYYGSIAVGLKIHQPDESGYNYNGIGVDYKELQAYDSALYYLGKAHAAAEKNHDSYLLSHNLADEGEVYNRLGRTADALTVLKQALPMQSENKDLRGFAETSVLLGDAYISWQEYVEAKLYFDSARTIATAIGAKDVLKNAWKGLSSVYKELNNYPASLDAYEHYAELKDTLYSEESSRQIAEMQTRYNTEKKEKENVLLQKANAVKDLQLTKERTKEYILAGAIIFLIVISVVYYRQYKLKQKNAMLKEREMRALAVFQAQEDEKAKLSKDLHDGVGALLSLIKLNISSIQADDTNKQILARTKVLATDVIKEVRGISHDLMPSVLAKSGLEAALNEMIESINASGSLTIDLNYTLTVRLMPVVEGNIFRIIQEATNNILKHAGATKEWISISANNGQLSVSISDDGKGFDKEILAKITGNGLNNIYSRVDALKGKADVITAAGKGTQIKIAVPLKTNSNG